MHPDVKWEALVTSWMSFPKHIKFEHASLVLQTTERTDMTTASSGSRYCHTFLSILAGRLLLQVEGPFSSSSMFAVRTASETAGHVQGMIELQETQNDRLIHLPLHTLHHQLSACA